MKTNKNKYGTLEFWRHRYELKNYECDWLDALATYYRDGYDEDRDIADELQDKYYKELKKFNKLYNQKLI